MKNDTPFIFAIYAFVIIATLIWGVATLKDETREIKAGITKENFYIISTETNEIFWTGEFRMLGEKACFTLFADGKEICGENNSI